MVGDGEVGVLPAAIAAVLIWIGFRHMNHRSGQAGEDS
jgi:hypothetical protein